MVLRVGSSVGLKESMPFLLQSDVPKILLSPS